MSLPVAGRTHGCGDLRLTDEGAAVRLCGWVDARRDHGGISFIDLRDRYGLVQVVADEESPEEARVALRQLHPEDCLEIRGRVRRRDEEHRNPNRETGDVEVLAESVTVLSAADRLPLEVTEELDAPEELRFQYRYLDMRRAPVRRILEQRSAANQAIRAALAELDFVEVETPLLTRSTPEGARDYLVPSRLRPGAWFALPQSPQLFKQLCMVGGLDRYFQIARCLRDEDLRADRQPEFTQLDLEMSFVDEADVQTVVERVVSRVFEAVTGRSPSLPYERMPYEEAIRRFASDKPDLRNPLEIVDLAAAGSGLGFKIFDGVLADGGLVRGMRLPAGASLARKQIDELEQVARDAGAGGAAWCKVGDDGKTSGPLGRFVQGEAGAVFLAALEAQAGDLVVTVADRPRAALAGLDAVRRRAGELLDVVGEEPRLLWVTEFPLFEEDGDGNWFPAHHPFTSPHPDDLEAMRRGQKAGIRSRAYDLVLDGVELGSGSIRIHSKEVQESVFAAIGLDPEEARERFEFLLRAFQYGPPPHGGFAVGLDRLYALLMGVESIREVIAFPKTSSGNCPLTGAPAAVHADQLRELGIETVRAALEQQANH